MEEQRQGSINLSHSVVQGLSHSLLRHINCHLGRRSGSVSCESIPESMLDELDWTAMAPVARGCCCRGLCVLVDMRLDIIAS